MSNITASTAHGVMVSPGSIPNMFGYTGEHKFATFSLKPAKVGEVSQVTVIVTGMEDEMKNIKAKLGAKLGEVFPKSSISPDQAANKYDRAEFVIKNAKISDVAQALANANIPADKAIAATMAEAGKSVQVHVNSRSKATGFLKYENAQQWSAAVVENTRPTAGASPTGKTGQYR